MTRDTAGRIAGQGGPGDAHVPAGTALITGARLAQPDGHLSSPRDLVIEAGRITAVVPSGTHDATDAAVVVDAGGRLALPGFIDTHVHGEVAVHDESAQHAMLRQGITTIVLGQDGVSFAPSPAGSGTAHWAGQYFAAINGTHPHFRDGSVHEFLAGYDGATALNVAYLAPHGAIRYSVLGPDPRPATAQELARMTDLLEAALRDGACGMSTGLEYVPGAYADTAEVAALARVVAARGLPHVSHMRGYGEQAPTGLAELLAIAESSGVATHVSHLHGPPQELISRIDAARAAGLDVTFDAYPYTRGCSILAMVALPTWLPLADADAALQALADPAVRERLAREHFPGLEAMWLRITMASVPTATGDLTWTEGRTLAQIAGDRPIGEVVLDLLVRTRLQASCVFARPGQDASDLPVQILTHPAHMTGSDAIYLGGHPHPRGWGAFAFLLREFVRERGIWSWADAVEHLSAAAARRFGLATQSSGESDGGSDGADGADEAARAEPRGSAAGPAGRGRIAPDQVADVALVDPDTVTDRATYADPRRLAVGIEDVLVRGVPVLAGGELTGARPGAPVTPLNRDRSEAR